MARSLALVALLLLTAPAAAAAWQRTTVPPEVSCTHDLAASGAGETFLVHSTSGGITATAYDAAGRAGQAQALDTDASYPPAVAASPGGGAVAAWQGSGSREIRVAERPPGADAFTRTQAVGTGTGGRRGRDRRPAVTSSPSGSRSSTTTTSGRSAWRCPAPGASTRSRSAGRRILAADLGGRDHRSRRGPRDPGGLPPTACHRCSWAGRCHLPRAVARRARLMVVLKAAAADVAGNVARSSLEVRVLRRRR